MTERKSGRKAVRRSPSSSSSKSRHANPSRFSHVLPAAPSLHLEQSEALRRWNGERAATSSAASPGYLTAQLWGPCLVAELELAGALRAGEDPLEALRAALRPFREERAEQARHRHELEREREDGAPDGTSRSARLLEVAERHGASLTINGRRVRREEHLGEALERDGRGDEEP